VLDARRIVGFAARLHDFGGVEPAAPKRHASGGAAAGNAPA